MKIKKLINFIEPKNLIYILILTLMITIPVITTLILSSNHYEDTINNLKLENKKHEYKIARLEKNLKEKNNTIEHLNEQVDGKKSVECNCGWYQDFYYEHAEEVGAYE